MQQDKTEPVSTWGYPAECQDFNARNADFIDAFGRLAPLIKQIFEREVPVKTTWDQFVFLIGRLVVEDFFEILLLAANGYGTGAQKLLRSMYELAVTARYLDQNPAEVDNFIDYHWVASQKLFSAVEQTFGPDFIPPELKTEAAKNYQGVRDRFNVVDCKKCGTRRASYTWSKTDFVTMAKTAGRLKTLLVPAYYMPLQHAHANLSILQPFLSLEQKTLTFEDGPTRELADSAAKAAHAIVIDTLRLVVDHFSLTDVEKELNGCEAEVVHAWPT